MVQQALIGKAAIKVPVLLSTFIKELDVVLLLDNMTPAQVRDAVAIIAGAAVIEVSGGVRYETLRSYALPGVEVISVGALTHSAPAADLSLTILPVRASGKK